jgi:hypothetical protein
MSTHSYDVIAARYRGSPHIVPMFLVFVGLFIVSSLLGVEDYLTSKWGYDLLPTQRGSWYISSVVGFLPQLGQLAAVYLLIGIVLDGNTMRVKWKELGPNGAAFIPLLLFISMSTVDIGTDVWFRTRGSVDLLATALVESIFIYTIGSEFFWGLSFGMLARIAPEGIIATRNLVWELVSSIFKSSPVKKQESKRQDSGQRQEQGQRQDTRQHQEPHRQGNPRHDPRNVAPPPRLNL